MSLEQSLCYYLSPVMLFVVCVVVPMLLAFFGLWISRKIIPARFVNQSHDVTGPFYSPHLLKRRKSVMDINGNKY